MFAQVLQTFWAKKSLVKSLLISRAGSGLQNAGLGFLRAWVLI
jgi:hypothetical protein